VFVVSVALFAGADIAVLSSELFAGAGIVVLSLLELPDLG
jgi:hypothetical protein